MSRTWKRGLAAVLLLLAAVYMYAMSGYAQEPRLIEWKQLSEVAKSPDERGDALRALMQGFLEDGRFLGASLIVRQNGEVVFQNKWGRADFDRSRRMSYEDIFRIYSMTKPITAVAVLILSERGLLSIDDPVRQYLPSFADMRVITDERFVASPETPLEEPMGGEETFLAALADGSLVTDPATSDLTIRDLLTHSSGLGEGLTASYSKELVPGLGGTLSEVAESWGNTYLAFEPGTGTGYSPSAGFDVLARIVEIVSGEPFETFIQREILDPLEMRDTTFHPTQEQREKLVSIVCGGENGLEDFTPEWESNPDEYQAREGYVSGSGGLFSTLEDYEHFAEMLCNNGTWRDRVILQPETVSWMRTEADRNGLNVESPESWGLGVRIRQNPDALPYYTVAGTYGWSGLAGTHFFVCPERNLDCVLMLNRVDIGGSESPVSLAVETAVLKAY